MTLSLVVCSCATEDRYEVVNVPYCEVPEGEPSSGLTENLHQLYKAGDSVGHGILSGMNARWPLGVNGAVKKTMLTAIVECPPSLSRPSTSINLGEKLTQGSVPKICENQRVHFHGTLYGKKLKDSEFAGVIELPLLNLHCERGTMKYSEPRLKSD